MSEYRIEYLGSDISVVVSDDHGFGTDAVLLADFASPKKKEKACDLGTGCGIIPMIWCRNGQADKIIGIEIQEKGFLQAKKSAEISGMSDKVTFINHDLKDIRSAVPHACVDVVTMNPPYKAAQSGIKSAGEAELIARHETLCTLQDVTDAAAYMLNFGGRLCLCNRPERLADTITAMKNSGIEPKKLRMVVKRFDSRPWLFLIEGKKGSKPYMDIMPSLIMYGDDGNLSEEVIKIYGEYKENSK